VERLTLVIIPSACPTKFGAAIYPEPKGCEYGQTLPNADIVTVCITKITIIGKKNKSIRMFIIISLPNLPFRISKNNSHLLVGRVDLA
jgi:hypothetical protein